MKMTNVQSGSGNLRIRAVILTANKFEDMELMVPYFRLLDAALMLTSPLQPWTTLVESTDTQSLPTC